MEWSAYLAVEHNVAGVALANKLARMDWAVLAKSQTYRPPLLRSQLRWPTTFHWFDLDVRN